jgi:hypothetical protein
MTLSFIKTTLWSYLFIYRQRLESLRKWCAIRTSRRFPVYWGLVIDSKLRPWWMLVLNTTWKEDAVACGLSDGSVFLFLPSIFSGLDRGLSLQGQSKLILKNFYSCFTFWRDNTSDVSLQMIRDGKAQSFAEILKKISAFLLREASALNLGSESPSHHSCHILYKSSHNTWHKIQTLMKVLEGVTL